VKPGAHRTRGTAFIIAPSLLLDANADGHLSRYFAVTGVWALMPFADRCVAGLIHVTQDNTR
jgi:hypothetical protein